ncbi:MAG: hypothetical protein OXK21_09545 [Chloroflexota bacterium]|nr:hypothetical protein [Chloroflexota bacterium]
MNQDARTKFQLSLGESTLEAPETPHYLEVAARLLEARRREIEAEQTPGPVTDAPDTAPAPPIASSPFASSPTATSPSITPRFPFAPSYPTAPRPPMRRAHWFSDRFPRITLEDGSVQIPRSLEELKGMLRARGITPHPRGDASMLLWQVRNRLKLNVETVGAQDF